MIKILTVTNDVVLKKMLFITLTINGFHVKSASNDQDVFTYLETNDCEFLLLDGDQQNLSLRLRANGHNLPILILRKCSHGIGLDDVEFLKDPFNFPSLKKQMNSMFIRRKKLTEEIIVHGQLKIDLGKQLVTIKDDILNLGNMEFAILVSLARRMGKFISKEKLQSDLEAQGEFFNTSIYHHIKELSRKLKDSTATELNLRFVIGQGYQLHLTG